MKRILVCSLVFSVFFLSSCSDSEGNSNSTRTSSGTTTSTSNTSGNTNSSSNTTTSASSLEQDAFDQVNAYRASKGLSALTMNSFITEQCRQHSQNMADGTVGFGHGGFDERANAIVAAVGAVSVAENVAFNSGHSDPVTVAVNGWIASPGHEQNMSGDFTKAGMGIVVTSDGKYYFTQMFAK